MTSPATDAPHPEHSFEQAYLDEAYRLHDLAVAERHECRAGFQAVDLATRQAMGRQYGRAPTRPEPTGLIVGRFDRADETLYVGLTHVWDDERCPRVINWRVAAADAFYDADPVNPGDLLLKRVLTDENRRLIRVIDEFDRRPGRPKRGRQRVQRGPGQVSDALLAELDRGRDGKMRQVVATIQREQHRIIRAAADQVLVVSGGPGTGKTVVGLHRAAWLAYRDERVKDDRILVVTPSPAMLDYTRAVLPTLLTEDNVHQVDMASLFGGIARIGGTDSVDAARVKGSAEMVQVLRRAVNARRRWVGDDFVQMLGSHRVVVPAARIRGLLTQSTAENVSYALGRQRFRRRFCELVVEAYQAASREYGRKVSTSVAKVERMPAVANAMDRAWAQFTPEEFLRSLYGTQTWLVEATDGVLSADDRASLFRAPARLVGEEPWTREDLACLDEVAALLGSDVPHYGHVVVDEAQDLSVMQARALRRRCPAGSFTVLGDLAQATGPWGRDSWEQLTGWLADTPTTVETLSVGYRVPDSVLELAAGQLPLIGPELERPHSVRAGRGAPVFRHTRHPLRAALDAAGEAAESGMSCAVVVDAERCDAVLRAAEDAGLVVADGRRPEATGDIVVRSAAGVKGLEYDAVVVVEPDRIVNSAPWGRNLLYVALTRCTQQLTVVYDAPLPDGLVDPTAPVAASEPLGVSAPKEDSRDLDALVAAVRSLGIGDRALVAALVERLHRGRNWSGG